MRPIQDHTTGLPVPAAFILCLTWIVLVRFSARKICPRFGLSWLRRLGADRPATVCCCCLVTATSFALLCWLATALSESAFRGIELNFFKHGFIHDFFQTAKNSTILPYQKELVVFQHIARTAGDASRTHLFHDVQLRHCPLWPWKDVVPPAPWTDFDIFESNETKMVQGYFSTKDLMQVKRPMKLFTILRHPHERALSFFKFTRGHLGRWNEYLGLLNKSVTVEAYFDPHTADAFYQSYVQESMTYQLGCYMHAANRSQCTPEETLARAKEWLTKMDFVAFFEDYMHDFPLLRRNIFPDVEVNEVFPFMFNLGLWFAYPKLRIKSLTSHLTPPQLELVKNATQMDLELYEFARAHFQKDFYLYESFDEFMIWNGPLLVVGVLLCIALCCYSVIFCDRNCSQKARSRAGRQSFQI